MNTRTVAVVGSCVAFLVFGSAFGQDWPQWRGPHRDAQVAEFRPPTTWPDELTQQWDVTVGEGVATPALAGGKLYVFGRQDGAEVVRCLDADSGAEIWQDKYEAEDADGAAARFAVLGPRSSPAVAEGKVVTLGTRGILTCYDAASGEILWRKDDYGSWPRFFVSSSPMLVNGLCIVQLGGDSAGGIVAYELSTGEEKWSWQGDGPAYGSPVAAQIGDANVVLAPTAKNLVAIAIADGELLWQIPYEQGRYNAATPIVHGQTVIYAGPTRGITAERLTIDNGTLKAEQVWSNPDNSLIYNTPALTNGLLFGLSNLNALFCVNVETGQTAWTAPLTAEEQTTTDASPQRDRSAGDDQRQGQSRERRRGRGRRGGGGGGYGSVVAAGDFVFALTPEADLIVFPASEQAFDQIAKYKVATEPTYSYPIIAGNRIFIKDRDSVTLWTLE